MSRPLLIADGAGLSTGPVGDRTQEVLARSLWAHGRDVRGMEALAAMAVNRRNTRPGATLAGVATDPTLFAAWDVADDRHGAMLRVDSCDPRFAAALRIARRAMAGAADLVAGATRFAEDTADLPAWAWDQTPVAMLSGFNFYKG